MENAFFEVARALPPVQGLARECFFLTEHAPTTDSIPEPIMFERVTGSNSSCNNLILWRHTFCIMGKVRPPKDSSGQKKLKDFEAKEPVKVLPVNAPNAAPEPVEQKINNARPKPRKTLVEEQLQRPEVKKVFKESEEKVAEGVKEEVATRWCERRLRETDVPVHLICTVIIKGKGQSAIWKRGQKSTRKWLSKESKHEGKAAAGRIGGIASGNAKKEQIAKSQTPEPIRQPEDSSKPPEPLVQVDERQTPQLSPTEQAVRTPPDIVADSDFSKPPDSDDLLNKNSANEIEDYPRPPVATIILTAKPGSIFHTSASAAL